MKIGSQGAMPPFDWKLSRFSPQPNWKSGDEHAVRGGDREQVQHDRLDRDHDRAERDQQEQERERQHEGEHERRRVLEQRVRVGRGRRAARDRVGRARDLPTVAGSTSLRSVCERVRSTPRRCRCRRAGSRRARRCGRVDVDLERAVHLAARERLPLQLGDRLLRHGRVGIRLDGDERRVDAARERVLDLVDRARPSATLFGSESRPDWAVCSFSTGSAMTSSTAWRRAPRRRDAAVPG